MVQGRGRFLALFVILTQAGYSDTRSETSLSETHAEALSFLRELEDTRAGPQSGQQGYGSAKTSDDG
jgi:hypothetical protein